MSALLASGQSVFWVGDKAGPCPASVAENAEAARALYLLSSGLCDRDGDFDQSWEFAFDTLQARVVHLVVQSPDYRGL